MCLEFIEMFSRETIAIDAKRAALTIESSTASVILIFSWYTDVKTIILELARRNVSKLYFLFINRLRDTEQRNISTPPHYPISLYSFILGNWQTVSSQ